MATYNQKNLIPKLTVSTRRGICQHCHRQFKSRNKKLATKLLMLHQEKCEKNAETNKTAEEVLSERSAINNKNTVVYNVNFRTLRIAFPSVDLPEPDSPTIPRVSPLSKSKLTFLTAWTDPTFL